MRVYSYIRFSSALQARGDSLRRQTKLARDWCDANGAELVEDLRDLGISAFKGRNSSKGALAAFLASIEAGRIVPGSTLLVESLDRITRTELSDALALFLRIINAGVRVVTLADNRSYERDTINAGLGELMMSLVILSRANEESRTKSQRLRAVWQQRRENIGKSKLATSYPHWLALDGGKFRKLAPAVAVVRRVFTLYAGGQGVVAIARALNAGGHPAPRGRAWRAVSVRHLLQSRAVIGELELGGVTVRGYYPPVVSQALFAACARVREGKSHKQGRTGAENIFRGLIFAPDGSPLHLSTFRRVRGVYSYLYAIGADGGRLGKSWRYENLREAFLRVCDAASTLPDVEPPDSGAALAGMDADIAQKQGELANLVRALAGGYSAALEAAVRSLESDLARLDRSRESIARERMDAPKSLRLIDWGDSEALAANVRATVRRIVVDIPGRSFRVEPYAGRVILYRTDGESVTIEAAAVPRSLQRTEAGAVAEKSAKRER